jgi:hypothetical protein
MSDNQYSNKIDASSISAKILDEIISSAVMQTEEGPETQIEVELTQPETLQQPKEKEKEIQGETVGK